MMYEGLSITFYIPRHLSFPSTTFEDGLALFLHDNDELSFMVKNSIRLRPGLAHIITYRKSETIFLPKPYTNCTTAVGRNLRHIYEVIFDPHLALQLMRNVFSLDHDRLLIANICMPATLDENCALNARQQIALNASLMAVWCSRCAPQYKHTQFSIDVSALPAPTAQQKASWKNVLLKNNSNMSLPDNFATNYDAYMDANYLRVTVACASPYVTIHQQQAKLTLIDTFSAIGGQTGL
ncbi:unnamed protein product, partial [Rotaria sp. Silwood1]